MCGVGGGWTSIAASMATTSEGWTNVKSTMAPTITAAPHTAVHTAVIKPLDIDDRNIMRRVMEPFRMALRGLEGHALGGH